MINSIYVCVCVYVTAEENYIYYDIAASGPW